MYAGGWISGTGAVAISTDRGANWNRTASAPTESVFGLEVHPTSAQRVYAATTGGIYRTTDAGASWSRVHSLAGMRAVAFFPGCPDTILAAGNRGVSVSEDGGATWNEMSVGLEEHPVTCLEFTSMDAVCLYAGTADAAAYRYSFLTGIAGPGSEASGRPRLSVRPSPASRRVSLTWPSRSAAGVRIVDASGRVVLRVHARGAASLDVSGLANGVYEAVPDPGSGLRAARFVVRR